MYSDNPIVFKHDPEAFLLASEASPTPIYYATDSPSAVVIAVQTFAEDVERVTGKKPEVKPVENRLHSQNAIYVGTVDSRLVKHIRGEQLRPSVIDRWSKLEGKWESWDVSIAESEEHGQNALVIGSDRRGVIYALYTLSSLMGVSPWYWWADVAITPRKEVWLLKGWELSHGPPTVKYRGFFLNDEQPVLWNWAYEHFKLPRDQPPFQVGIYEKVFELCLRLKGNYMWPAMWCSMFGVDGQDISKGLPSTPTPGPNQALAERMGIVMGTSHHEPMLRNQKEYTDFGSGEWDYVKNGEWLRKFWEYGVERAKAGDCETVFTVGMRGDGDIELGNATAKLLEGITSDQQDILRKVLDKEHLDNVPQMWAMYKEVMGFFANGLQVPKTVTPLLADDNWGNLMAVMPDMSHRAGGGIYYHADYVGDPRSYKWISTVPLAKMWEQLNVATSFDTTQIWILNVGDLKMLETPLEWFMDIAYDSSKLGRDSLIPWLTRRSMRDYGVDRKTGEEIAKITAEYSVLASRRKAEMLDDKTFSIIAFYELERVLAQWDGLEQRAQAAYEKLSKERQLAFYEMLLVSVQLQSNLNHLYAHVAKSNLHATQGRSSANLHADKARELFERDADLTEKFHRLLDGKWNHMLSQAHIGYQYWQAPSRQSLPPTSRVSTRVPSYDHGTPIHTRITVEDCFGAWPGDNKYNSPLGYNAPDPVLLPMDRYGRPRWVEIASGGPHTVTFTARPRERYVKNSVDSGRLTPGGADDARVWISIDWDTTGRATAGHVDITSSDGAKVTITLPLIHAIPPLADFFGSIEGDGYVAIEARDCTTTAQGGRNWEEIPYYGRTISGMGIFPVGDFDFALGKGPSMRYDFWLTSKPKSSKVPVTLHIGPTLNYILGKRLAFGIQLDDGETKRIEPVPEAPLGSLPHDWENVVAEEVRKIATELELSNLEAGRHTLTVWGVTTGIIVERVLVDLGGIKTRGDTYLGPPASIVV